MTIFIKYNTLALAAIAVLSMSATMADASPISDPLTVDAFSPYLKAARESGPVTPLQWSNILAASADETAMASCPVNAYWKPKANQIVDKSTYVYPGVSTLDTLTSALNTWQADAGPEYSLFMSPAMNQIGCAVVRCPLEEVEQVVVVCELAP